MKSFFKIFIYFFIFSTFFFFSKANAQVSEIQGEHIQSFDGQIKINKDGTIDVEERIVYDFSTLQRHGIYREIPYVKTNKAGNPTSLKLRGARKFRLDFKNISITDEAGKNYQYKKSEENEKLRLKIGDPNRTISGIHTYIINYQVAGALTYFSDHDELYWNATGNDWAVPISGSTSGVKLPVGMGQNEASAICYTGQSGSTEQNCTSEIIGNKVEFKTNNLLNSYEGLTITVSFPKNIVAVLEPKPYITFWETFFGKIIISLIILTAIFWYVVYPIWIPIKWLKEGKDPKQIGTGEVRAWYDPPKSKSGRVLSPEETGALVDERADIEDISGMIVWLAQKGYIKIEEREKGKFFLVKNRELAGETNLLVLERNFLHALFQSGDEVSLKTKETFLYTAVEEAKKGIYEQLVSSGFFPQDPNKIRTFYTVVGGLAVTTLNFILAFSAFFFGRNMPKKTNFGVEAANVAKSLRNFLTSQERQLEFQAKNQMFFEKLLPYAVVFGVEKIWAERFKDIQMKQPDWYQGYSSGGFNSVYLTSSLSSSFSSFQTAATPTSSSSGFGSGFSGGSSGGGGGGGGGGSW